MKFELLPVLDCMLSLYQLPPNRERFKAYLNILGTEKGRDFLMPISGFNPMAKTHVNEKLMAMKQLEAENMIAETIAALNTHIEREMPGRVFKIAFNLADDLKGGWTHRFSMDYDSKFKINALVTRNFCVPFFWTSESISAELIKNRTTAYAHRTRYWLLHKKPVTLKDHIDQEVFVAQNLLTATPKESFSELDMLDSFYKANQESDNQSLIFNFLYGDEASSTLSFPSYHIQGEMPGFRYANWIAQGKNIGNRGL